MIGPISFSDETARRQLLAEGEVITFRKRRRTTGETHARWERTGKAKADVTVERVGMVAPTPDGLGPFVDRSGFASVADWQDAIRGLGADGNGSLPDTGYLYRVEFVRWRAAATEADRRMATLQP